MKINRKQTGKSILSLVLVFAMLLSFIPITSVSAAEKTYDVFSAILAAYKDNGDVQSVTQNENWDANLVASDNVAIQSGNG